MLAVNYSNMRKNFKNYCDIANNDFETIIVTRKEGGNVVILSESEYNNMKENLYIMGNHNNYMRLIESIKQFEQGNFKVKELIEE